MQFLQFHQQNCDIQQTTHFWDVTYTCKPRETIFNTFCKYGE